MSDTRLTIRIDGELHRKLSAKALELQADYSHVVREALDQYLQPTDSAYDAFKKAGLIGIVKTGKADLSTNKKYMKGFGLSK